MKEFGLPLVTAVFQSLFMALSEGVGTIPAFGRLWKFKAPPKILVFGWLAI